MKELELTIQSLRGSNIPVSIIDCEKENAGFVAFIHGFGANRHEDGRFTQVGRRLAKHGISSIRMGFPGCDESKEDFINYTLKNCLNDMNTCIQYMFDHYSIDKKRLGMLGYSMGGRLTAIFINSHPEYKCIGFWAGATYTGFEDDKFLGLEVDKAKKEANEKGYVDYFDTFDNEYIKLNKELLDQIEEYDPQEGVRKYRGSCIVVHGDKDITVKPKIVDTMRESLRNANAKFVMIHEADHGFGQWEHRPELSNQLVDVTSDFFLENL